MRTLLPAERFIYEMFMDSSVKVKKITEPDYKTCMAVKAPKGFKGW